MVYCHTHTVCSHNIGSYILYSSRNQADLPEARWLGWNKSGGKGRSEETVARFLHTRLPVLPLPVALHVLHGRRPHAERGFDVTTDKLEESIITNLKKQEQ